MSAELTPSSDFFSDVRGILADARRAAYTAVNSAMVAAYWQIGRRIVEEEQGGEAKANYGDGLLKELSRALTAEFGKGFSLANLKNFRKFYLTFPDREKSYTLCSLLTWSHNRLIMREEDPSARLYYLQQAKAQNWSVRQLQRQIETRSYQRLLSTQATESTPEPTVSRPSIRDFIKDPYVLEFLGLPEDPAASETEVESAIISRLQSFLLEMGHGFSFVARQMRVSTETSHFYLQIPHRPPQRSRTHRRTRTRTPNHRTTTERRRCLTLFMTPSHVNLQELTPFMTPFSSKSGDLFWK